MYATEGRSQNNVGCWWIAPAGEKLCARSEADWLTAKSNPHPRYPPTLATNKSCMKCSVLLPNCSAVMQWQIQSTKDLARFGRHLTAGNRHFFISLPAKVRRQRAALGTISYCRPFQQSKLLTSLQTSLVTQWERKVLGEFTWRPVSQVLDLRFTSFANKKRTGHTSGGRVSVRPGCRSNDCHSVRLPVD